MATKTIRTVSIPLEIWQTFESIRDEFCHRDYEKLQALFNERTIIQGTTTVEIADGAEQQPATAEKEKIKPIPLPPRSEPPSNKKGKK